MSTRSALPTGTVTMLFTDIEGSTRLLKRLGEGYGDLLAEHRRLLRAAFAEFGGREMDTQGDAFFVVFDRARNGVGAAVAAQRALAAHAWPEGAECRVRMGLHTGEPNVGDEGYHGMGVHRGARICAVAHGGQVLLSNTTRELVEDELPAGVELRDLGERQLKDIDRPERVYQLEIDGLPSEFPLATAEPAPARSRRRRPLLLGVGILALCALVAAVAALLTTGGGPGSASAAGEVSANSVGIVNPQSGRISGQIPVGSSPSAVTVGSGSIWVTNIDDHSVSRIDAAKQVVVAPIQVGNGPDGIVFGAGKIWVTNGLDGTVSEIDPQTNTVVDVIPDVGNGPSGIAVSGRYLWVANSNDGTLARVDPVSGAVRTVTSVGSGADGVAVGRGSIWVTNQSAGTVTRIDARSGSVLRTINAGSGAGALAVGAGLVWVANSLDGTVTEIDPSSDAVRSTIPVGDGPNGVALAPGAIWVSNELGGTLSRIDPARGAVVRTVATGNRPEGVVVDGGSLFVAVRASGAAHRGETLSVLTTSGGVPNIDPALGYGPEELQLLSVTNDGLTGFRRVSGIAGTTLVPDLAVSLPTPTGGGLFYSFQLRPGIRYSTGVLVRPQDFRRAIERSLVEGDEGIYFSHIVGAPACIAHPEKACDLSRGVVVNAGSNTLTFHLSSPDPDLLYELALNAAYAVPVSTPLHVHGALPATGPYMFASFTPKRSVRLVRNPRFREWSPAAQPDGFPNQIVMRFGGTPAAHIASVERGAADVASDYAYISPAVLASLRTEHASRLEINPEGSTAAIVFNTRLAPFDNLKARQAVSFALDRQRLLTLTLGQSLGQVTCQILPPNFAGYRRYCPYTVDPAPGGEWVAPDLARARELVRESGTFGEAVTFWIPRWIKFDAAAGRYVVSVLDSLGYKARFRFAADPYAHENALGVQAGFWAWYADFAAPSGFVRNTLTCSSYTPIGALNANSAEFCDHAIDREIGRAQLLQTSNPEAAAQLWAKVDRDLTNQAPWASFANGTVLELISTRVGNYQFNPAWFTLLDQLWLK